MASPFQTNIFQYIFNTDMSFEENVYQGNVFQGTVYQPKRIIRRSITANHIEESTPHMSVLRRVVNRIMKITSPTVADSTYQDNVYQNSIFDTHVVKEAFAFLGFLKVISHDVNVTKDNYSFRGMLKIHDTDMNIDSDYSLLRSLIRIVDHDVNVQSFREKLRSLLKIFDESIHIDHEVNLERSMKINDRLDGHLVQGHVESIGKILSKLTNDGETKIKIEIEKELLKYCIYKGSITFDGVSLTISQIASCSIEVSIIPYTLANTTLGSKSVGDYVNVETDMIAKYVSRQMDFKK